MQTDVEEVCAEQAADASTAVRVAETCDVEVEVVSERTPWDTVFATPDGLTRVETSATAVRTDVNGAWEQIDTTVVESAAGLEVVAPTFEMRFSDGTDPAEPLARIVKDGHELTFDVPFELTDPAVDGAQVTYPEVLEDVDLIVTVDEDGTGFSEVLRVATPEAAANPELAQLSFPVTTSEGLSVSSHDGGFEASDAAGDKVFTSPTPLMWDSATPTSSAPPSGGLSPLSAFRSLAGTTASAEHAAVAGEVTAADRAAAPLVSDDVAPMPATVGSQPGPRLGHHHARSGDAGRP
ncbi:hypothetical protein [Cellulosimicrobium sp. NPDC057127]|uniref:hypothetical protein n=1 Tax=Cellulosimicrobium sp. NPDC057127 TaxID=3346026 RepID=UPI00362CB2F2